MNLPFRRPLGLVLAGGGSHGAWQSGCLSALCEAGLGFDRVLGFSAGSLTGVAYALGIERELRDRWSAIDGYRMLRFRPRFSGWHRFPVSLYSDEPFDEALAYVADDEECRRRLRCELVVVSHRVDDRSLEYARFTPRGERGWDGPLLTKLKASCAVPWMFPPVRAGGSVLVDGGVGAREPMRFDAMAGCADVLALQMTRPEESGKLLHWLKRGPDQLGREVCLKIMDGGLAALARLPGAPRVFRLLPSAVLDYNQLSFRAADCLPAFRRGLEDAGAFLRAPVAY